MQRITTLLKAKFGRGLPFGRQHELKQLTEIETKGVISRRRFWERDYLQAVYEFYCDWRAAGQTNVRATQMAKVSGISPARNSHPIRIIVDCSSPNTDAKIKSRWTLALRNAEARGIKPSNLQDFFKKKGGLAGRANALTKAQRDAAAVMGKQAATAKKK